MNILTLHNVKILVCIKISIVDLAVKKIAWIFGCSRYFNYGYFSFFPVAVHVILKTQCNVGFFNVKSVSSNYYMLLVTDPAACPVRLHNRKVLSKDLVVMK